MNITPVFCVVVYFCVIFSALAVFECGNHETATFVRISRARLDGTPLVVSTAGHDLTCSQYCRNNIGKMLINTVKNSGTSSL